MPRRRCSHGQAPRSEAPRPTRTQRGQLSEISWSPPQISLVWQLMKYELKWVELNGFQDASTPIGYAKKVTYQEEDEEKARPDADGRGGDGCCSLGGPAPGCPLLSACAEVKLGTRLQYSAGVSNSDSNSEQDVSCSAGRIQLPTPPSRERMVFLFSWAPKYLQQVAK